MEDIRDFSVVVTRTVKDKRDLCGRLTMTDLRRGYWGWSSRCIYHVDSDSLAIHWEKKIFEEQFRKGDEPKNLFQSLKEFQYDHEHEKLEAGVIYELRAPQPHEYRFSHSCCTGAVRIQKRRRKLNLPGASVSGCA